MESKVFSNYKASLNSFKEGCEKFLGILEPGRVRGFDTLFIQTGLTFGLSHNVTGIVKTKLNPTEVSNKTGVIFSKQGVILQVEGDLTDLSVIPNTGEEAREDIIYLDITYLADEETIDYGVFGVLPGGGELTNTMVEVGRILVQPDAITLDPNDYTPAQVKSIGGVPALGDVEIIQLIEDNTENMVTTNTAQEVTGEKNFTNPSATKSGRTLNIFESIDVRKSALIASASNRYIEVLNIPEDSTISGMVDVSMLVSDSSTALFGLKASILLSKDPNANTIRASLSSVEGQLIASLGTPLIYFRKTGGRYILSIRADRSYNVTAHYMLNGYVDLTGALSPVTVVGDLSAYLVRKSVNIYPNAKILDLNPDNIEVGGDVWELEVNNGQEHLLYYGSLLNYEPGVDHYTLYSTGNGLQNYGANFLIGIRLATALYPPVGKRITIRFAGAYEGEDGFFGSNYPLGILDFRNLDLAGYDVRSHTLQQLKGWGLRLNRLLTPAGGFRNWVDKAGVDDFGNILDSSQVAGANGSANEDYKLPNLVTAFNTSGANKKENLVIKATVGGTTPLYLKNGLFEFMWDGLNWVEVSRSIWF